MEPGPIDLSITLVPHERAAIEAQQGDPNDFLAIDFPIADLRAVSVSPKGAVFVAQFVVPDGTFEFLSRKSVVLGPDGKAPAPNMNDWVGVRPALRLVLRKAAFTANAQDELQKGLAHQKFAAELIARSHQSNAPESDGETKPA